MTDMIRRFDRNGNNMIDPDETQGPAGFFLQRMAQSNPKIDLSKPIPIDLITSEMEKARGGRGDSPDGSDSSTDAKSNEPKLLVPDFKLSSELPKIPGFGNSADAGPSIKLTDRDKAEAEERIRRYDRNGDKILNAEELSQSRFSAEDIAQYDKNKDGKLTIDELAVRQAMRRMSEQQQNGGDQSQSGGWGGSSGGWGSSGQGGWSRGDRGDDRGNNGGNSSKTAANGKEEEKRFGDAKSYRTSSSNASVSGLPSFFTSSDINNDSQVTLSEFAGTLTESAMNEFQQWDLNSDGIITARECQVASKAGVQVGGSSSSKPSSGSTSSASKSGGAPLGKYSEADVDWAKKQILKYDKDNDGLLSKDEAAKMLAPPKGADVNNDGKITAEEYAAFRAK